MGLTDRVAELLVATRSGLNTQHTLYGQFRQSVYSRLAGYDDTNDAEQLCKDPAIRQVVGKRAKEHKAASTSQMGRFTD
ncbi:MAG: transposase [SAR324 cluster bacterium]|nr:transposase [SAR324 cluster bacterium]